MSTFDEYTDKQLVHDIQHIQGPRQAAMIAELHRRQSEKMGVVHAEIVAVHSELKEARQESVAQGRESVRWARIAGWCGALGVIGTSIGIVIALLK